MHFYLLFLFFGGLACSANAQSCIVGTSTCSTCVTSQGNRWCSNSASGYTTGGCCISSLNTCPSSYIYSYYSSCSYYDYVYTRAPCGAGCIVGTVIGSIFWVVNMVAVVKYCRDRGIPPVGYVVIAFFFGAFVWCCLASAGRQQLVIVQGNVPYQAQPGGGYPAQSVGQPSYGQPYANAPPYAQPQQYVQQGTYIPPPAGYAGAPHNPYVQPANPYAQPANPYVSNGEISKPQ